MSEPKKWVEIALMPLVIAIVGILGTYLVTNEQQKAAEVRAAAVQKSTEIRAATDRQIKILDIFADKIVSPEEKERLFATRLTMSMDSDLAIKIMTAIDLDSESSKAVKDAVKSLTSHAIISKLAESKRGLAYQAAILEGRWALGKQEAGIRDLTVVNSLEFKTNGESLTVEGACWKGQVTFDGKHGYYQWEFDDGRTGRTDIYIDSTGILFGRVKGVGKAANIDWTYWATRAQISSPPFEMEPGMKLKDMYSFIDEVENELCKKKEYDKDLLKVVWETVDNEVNEGKSIDEGYRARQLYIQKRAIQLYREKNKSSN